jgi:hypothetical protein
MAENPSNEGKPLYLYNSDLARKLADTAAITQDLSRTLAFVTRLIDEKDILLQDALFTAALISYRRCFASGTRSILSESDIVDLRPQAKEIHDYYMATADKFAAHSVNPFEQLKTGVFIHDNEIVGGGSFSMRLITFDKDGLAHWANLINLIMSKLGKSCREMEGAMVAEAKTRPIAAIVRAGTVKIRYDNDPTKRRSFDE